MRLSREKIIKLSNLITKGLEENESVQLNNDSNKIRLKIVKFLTDELKIDDVVDQEVKRILNTYSRKIVEGSREWDVMYQKLYEQEMNKRKKF